MPKHQGFKKSKIFQPFFFTCHLPGRQNIFSNFPDLAGAYGSWQTWLGELVLVNLHYVKDQSIAIE